MLRGRQRDVAIQPVLLELAVHCRHVAALHLLEAALDHRQVALLVAGLARGVGLLLLQGEAVQAHRGAQHAGAVEAAQHQVALLRALAVLDQFHQRRVRGQRRLAGVALGAQPLQHRGFLAALDRQHVVALEPGQLAVVVLAGVVPTRHGRGVLHRDVGILLAGGLDQRDLVLVRLGDGRVAPRLRVLEFGHQRIAVGAARVAGHHHEVARAQRLVGDLQPVLRLVRHVVLAEGRRLAVLAHVGAVEREVAGVAGPHPVVDVAAELADAAGGRIRQAHVLDLEVLEQAVGVAAHEAVDPAAVARLGFARGGGLLLERLQRIRARHRVLARRRHRRLRLRRHVGDVFQHVDARVRACRDLIGQRGRVEAVADQVLLRRGVELDRTVGAVVVGGHQALRGDEAGGAAAQRDHRAHRVAGEVGQLLRVQPQAGLLQRAGDLRQLLRHPHALVRVHGQAESHRRHGDSRGQHRLAHHRVLAVSFEWSGASGADAGVIPPAGPFPSAGAVPGRPWPAASAGNACRRGSRACSAGRTSSWR